MHALFSPAGLIAAALSVGALAWFFFIQTPLLARRLGRDRFVPLQMSLVRPLFNTVAIASSVLAVATIATEHTDVQMFAAAASLALAVLCATVVVPRALRAGGRSLAQPLAEAAQHAAGRFIADGGGDASRSWHRALALITLGIVIAQVTWLVSPRGSAAHDRAVAREDKAASSPLIKADAATADGVRHLRELVSHSLAEGPQTGASVGEQLQRAYADIFARCTMTGAAHEALHAYLSPMSDMMVSVATAADPETTRTQLERLRAQLNRWDAKFE